MKAEIVYNVAIHLSNVELIRLQKMIEIRIKEIPKSKKKPFDMTQEEAAEFIKMRCFSRKKSI